MRTSWDVAEQQALAVLRDLIRLNTTNPPGNERIATAYLSPLLTQAGFDPIVIESAPTRSNLIVRLAGRDRSKPPLLLSAHTDVVPVEPGGWSRPPFDGEISDGCIWGRGAIDMKAKCAMDSVVAIALKRAAIVPDRDLIIAAVADEEAGSEFGAKYLVERHPDLVRAGYVLNEVGGFTLHLGGKRYYPIQVAEKGYVTVRMTVKAPPGHGSMPRRDTAIAKMAELLTKITNTPMRQRVTPVMEATLREFGVTADAAPPVLRAMLSNTVSPTILRAGYKDNVIPGEASIVLDGRTLPGEDPESFMAELRAIVGPEPTFELLKTAPPAEASADTELFALMKERTEVADPGSHALAWMIPGATDNKFYSLLGAVCYGFSPIKLAPHMQFGSLFHGNDERVPVEGFFWGLRLFADVVLSFLGVPVDSVFA